MTSCLGWLCQAAIINALMANSRSKRLRIDQPTTWREKRSSTTARYNQPSWVRM